MTSRMDRRNCRREAGEPAPAATLTALPNDLGGSIGRAFVIPFLPFEIIPLGEDHGFHGSIRNRGNQACAEKEFPKSEKGSPRAA